MRYEISNIYIDIKYIHKYGLLIKLQNTLYHKVQRVEWNVVHHEVPCTQVSLYR